VIPSVSHDIKQLHACIDYIISEFEALDAPYFINKNIINNKPSLLVANFDIEKKKHADIVLNWHIDVVPPDEEDQFEPKLVWNKLYARWAGDMKSGVAVMIQVMKDIIADQYTRKDILLMVTSDEEVGGYDGVWALTALWRWWDLVLIPDGGSIDRIISWQKGIYMMTVEAYGKSCHSSRPWLGENAIHNIVNYFTDIKTKIQDTEAVYFSDNHRWTSVNFNMIEAGTAINKVPSLAKARFDIRFTEKYTLKEIKEICLSFMPSYNCRLIGEITWEAIKIAENDSDMQRYIKSTQKFVPNVELEKEHGWSDGRFFSAAWSKVIIHKPTDDHIHESWEWVDIDTIWVLYNIYMDFILVWDFDSK